ncbi:hypothetical protein [Avibacterium volantium]|uniref:Lipoprotein n=1 Tax=Avibacterium volantium TaxID=762 RepID=A0A3S4IBM4_AVIVO|nr:hypothetical protein [Avibacterium volantium]VEB22832.1 Uncharacterised protein [Avibacterium volantium]
MRIVKFSLFMLFPLSLCACAAITGSDDLASDLKTLSIVQENHAVITENAEKYVLDTYIQLFSRPYFIYMVKQNATPINEQTAINMAKAYIQPRSCTSPIENVQIVKKLSNQSQLIIRLEC